LAYQNVLERQSDSRLLKESVSCIQIKASRSN
jgi:hypothetical protein